MKVSDSPLRIDFRTLLATHLRMIHELGAVNQQFLGGNGHGAKVVKVRIKGCVKTYCGNSFIQHICTNASGHGNQFLVGSLRLKITSCTPLLVAVINQYIWRLHS